MPTRLVRWSKDEDTALLEAYKKFYETNPRPKGRVEDWVLSKYSEQFHGRSADALRSRWRYVKKKSKKPGHLLKEEVDEIHGLGSTWPMSKDKILVNSIKEFYQQDPGTRRNFLSWVTQSELPELKGFTSSAIQQRWGHIRNGTTEYGSPHLEEDVKDIKMAQLPQPKRSRRRSKNPPKDGRHHDVYEPVLRSPSKQPIQGGSMLSAGRFQEEENEAAQTTQSGSRPIALATVPLSKDNSGKPADIQVSESLDPDQYYPTSPQSHWLFPNALTSAASLENIGAHSRTLDTLPSPDIPSAWRQNAIDPYLHDIQVVDQGCGIPSDPQWDHLQVDDSGEAPTNLATWGFDTLNDSYYPCGRNPAGLYHAVTPSSAASGSGTPGFNASYYNSPAKFRPRRRASLHTVFGSLVLSHKH